MRENYWTGAHWALHCVVIIVWPMFKY
ncbi:hypothetical protein AZE42_06472 [Rhizopogon vesiculosus]|uniref:Uncharacterized protein n=1 Tax=Rhizopogon vesiculosus TaxID=180088 RepID=A0A1J8PXJ6_9AGAM|nr:hypothetical protein AZE42_06472 [Rhizopogon vesiculosus]